jgi:hypothetical protein
MTGMGGAGVALEENLWAAGENPAGLAGVQYVGIAASFVPAQYGLSEFRTIALAGVLPLGAAAAGVSAMTFGFELYRELNVSTAIGAAVTEWIEAGLTVRFQHLKIRGYGEAGRVSAALGLTAHMGENVNVGACVRNVGSSTLGRTGERLPAIMQLGTTLEASEETVLALEIEKHVLYPTAVKFGVEQKLLGAVALRGGAATNPDRYAVGCSFLAGPTEFGYAGVHHAFLGWTHQVDLQFRISAE